MAKRRVRRGRELAGRGAGELSVRRPDLGAAGSRRHLRHLVQPGAVRVEGHPKRPRQLPQDVGRAARALEGVHPVGRRPAGDRRLRLPGRRQTWHPPCRSGRRSTAGQIYDAANQRYTIDAEPNVAMMDYFVAWLDEEYQGDFSQVQRSGAWQAVPERRGQPPQFQAGNLAMMEWGSWGLGDFYAYGEPAFERLERRAVPGRTGRRDSRSPATGRTGWPSPERAPAPRRPSAISTT